MLTRLSLRIRVFLFFALLGLAAPLFSGGAVWLLGGRIEAPWGLLFVVWGGSAFLTIALTVGIWLLFDINVVSPIQALIRDLQIIMHANPNHQVDLRSAHFLGLLSETLSEITHLLSAARRQTAAEVAAAVTGGDELKSRLEATLRDLHDGVIICNLNHRVLLYNQKALEMLHVAGELGLGRSLFRVLSPKPLRHTLERLSNRYNENRHKDHPLGLASPVICSTADGRSALQSQMSLVIDKDGGVNSYVLTFKDITDELAALGKRDILMRRAIEDMRRPLANLRAASETLCAHSDMDEKERINFDKAIYNEALAMSECLQELAKEYHDVITGYWPMTNIYSANLISCVVRRLSAESGFEAVMTGLPCWLYGDSHSLVELLSHLICKVSERASVKTVDIRAETADGHHVYLDIIWQGEAIPSAEIDCWLDASLLETLGGMTALDIMEHHELELWSQPHKEGCARLRLPLPKATQAIFKTQGEKLPERPEFYDFDLLEQPGKTGDSASAPLKSLSYVVFDTETTGLKPSEEDEIISIAGVRVVNGRILTGETFSRMINPGRAIPEKSTRFHGITDAMVKDKPPIQVILRQFKEFVGDSVLVAHNAAFDMKFLSLKEDECGVCFDNQVLDTLLLSVFLYDQKPEHTLDAIAARFGVQVQGRHTALGDSLMTAGIFLRMMDVLEARGVETLDQALQASSKAVEARKQQKQF